MKWIFTLLVFLISVPASAQVDSIVLPESPILDLEALIDEALEKNPDIEAALREWEAMEARVPMATGLDDPELMVMREEMPGFRYGDARFTSVELSQRFRLPSKIGLQGDIARMQAQHAHHNHLEALNELVATVRSAYAELWFVQQNSVLKEENLQFMTQFADVARIRYGNGQAQQQDVLKATVEISMLQNDLIALRQQELSTKAMLMALLNREPADTLGFAVIAEDFAPLLPIDSLRSIAFERRPMLKHDSVSIRESQAALALAKQMFIPDFSVGIQYMRMHTMGENLWTVKAGIMIPFAPWVLGKTRAGVQEAEIMVKRSAAMYTSTRNMITSRITDLYHNAAAARRQLENFSSSILPQADQSLQASLTAYQNGRTDFLMLLDAYRTQVDLRSEYFMLRMRFEQALANLERETAHTKYVNLNY